MIDTPFFLIFAMASVSGGCRDRDVGFTRRKVQTQTKISLATPAVFAFTLRGGELNARVSLPWDALLRRAHTFNVRSCPDHASDTSQTMDALTNVYHDHPKAVLFSTAAALRILLALTFPGLPDLLTGRVEISTPVNSFKRCTWHIQVDHWPQWLRSGQELRPRSAGRLVPI